MDLDWTYIHTMYPEISFNLNTYYHFSHTHTHTDTDATFANECMRLKDTRPYTYVYIL